MTFTALRRPCRLHRTAAQLTDARRLSGRLTARWTEGAGGPPVLEWTFERPTPHFINRKRGSDA
jgi:hypothetical protein